MHQSRVTLAEENGYQSGHMSWIMIMGKEISRYSPKEGFLCSYLIPIYIYIFFYYFNSLSKVRDHGSRLLLPFFPFSFAPWGLSNKVVSSTLRIRPTSYVPSFTLVRMILKMHFVR